VLTSNSRNCAISAASAASSGCAGLIFTVDMEFIHAVLQMVVSDTLPPGAIDATELAFGRIESAVGIVTQLRVLTWMRFG
jgi:hypothetical protein